ncbi:MAG: 2-amino-4-hydroxy-6-hydroxymethyldihydropteridine diphosphokinase [Bacteroidia bacterium]|nr:2-amino-4-hydroxy-6-hydroxymethyldihydropteridine diphosphokinase [Bacteroidia bacterium]
MSISAYFYSVKQYEFNTILMLGGNLGDVKSNFESALSELETDMGSIFKKSSLYQSDPWGDTDQPPFLNQAIWYKTSLEPGKLLEMVLEIENKLGRVRNRKNGPRIMDIDILLIDNQIINEPKLIVPHPRMHLRRFNMLPLAELVPEWIHPVLGKSMSDLMELCEDESAVFQINH